MSPALDYRSRIALAKELSRNNHRLSKKWCLNFRIMFSSSQSRFREVSVKWAASEGLAVVERRQDLITVVSSCAACCESA